MLVPTPTKLIPTPTHLTKECFILYSILLQFFSLFPAVSRQPNSTLCIRISLPACGAVLQFSTLITAFVSRTILYMQVASTIILAYSSACWIPFFLYVYFKFIERETEQ